MKEEKVYKFLVCKKGLIQTDKIDCIYIRMPYLTPLGTLSGMRIKNENIKDKTNRYPIIYPIFHRI